MKKTILKLLSGAIMLSMLGTGASAMAFDGNPASFEEIALAEESFQPSENYSIEEAVAEQGEEFMDVEYNEEDDVLTVTPWFNGIAGAPLIILSNGQDESEEIEFEQDVSEPVIESLDISEV